MSEHLTFTPGPWRTEYRKSKRGGYAQEVFDADGEVIAVASWYPVRVSDTTTATNREANAQLIAAAPELLEALQAVLRWCIHEMLSSVQALRAGWGLSWLLRFDARLTSQG